MGWHLQHQGGKGRVKELPGWHMAQGRAGSGDPGTAAPAGPAHAPPPGNWERRVGGHFLFFLASDFTPLRVIIRNNLASILFFPPCLLTAPEPLGLGLGRGRADVETRGSSKESKEF